MEWNRRCGCSHEALAAPPKRALASYNVQEVDGLSGKAAIYPGTGTIQVDKRLFSRLSPAQRTAVLAHEVGHDEDPSACERCVDARAGARMRHAGMGAREAVQALGSVVQGRRTDEAVLYGWKAADAFLRERAGQRGAGELVQRQPVARPRGAHMLQGPTLHLDGEAVKAAAVEGAANGVGFVAGLLALSAVAAVATYLFTRGS